jgi:AraC-like DNA-binding protein
MADTPEFRIDTLIKTETVSARNFLCNGVCRHRSTEECVSVTRLVFPYRGVYVRHVGDDQAVADANHVLFFNADEGYQISHPLPGGDASLSLALTDETLLELVPRDLLKEQERPAFRWQHRQIDVRAQALVMVLRNSLLNGHIEPLEAEGLLLTLISRSLGPRTSRAPGSTFARRRLADRVKILLASDPSRRWTLAEIATQIGGSPVYLTQVFRQTEGLPLYRYQLHLRLARALDLIDKYDDLSALATDLGFSSHSHFSAAFRQSYGRSPSEFKQLG